MKCRLLLLFSLLIISTSVLRAQINDVVEFTRVGDDDCCMMMVVVNEHDPSGPINAINLKMLTDGVYFAPGPVGTWPIAIETSKEIEYGEQGFILQPGEFIDGFDFCMEFDPGTPRTFEIVWETLFNGQVVSTETVTLDCPVIVAVCDTILVTSTTLPSQPDGTCCYEITLENRHEPKGDLNDFHLTLQTPGMSFEGAPKGPWPVTWSTPTSISYATTSSPLSTGQSLSGFVFCVKTPDGDPADIELMWSSSFDGATVCENFVTLSCSPKIEVRCDTFLIEKQQDCSYNVGFINLHRPKSGVERFKMNVFTAGASFESVTAPAGWSISSQTGLNVRFVKDEGEVASGDSVKGFAVTFNPSNSGDVSFTVCTMSGNLPICCDTMNVHCDPPLPVFCDSLLVLRAQGACTYDIGFVNTHQPPSAINDFHINLESPEAEITSVIAPSGWIIEQSSKTQVVFRDTSGSVSVGGKQTGFLLSLDPGNISNTIVFEWCTSLDGSVICCQRAAVNCEPPEEKCDSLFYSGSPQNCSYEFGFANLRSPASDINDFHLEVTTPQALLWNAAAPAGWTVENSTDTEITFRKNSGVIAPGKTVTGFVLDFVPSAQSSQIEFNWCTSLDGGAICCDTGSVSCEINIVKYDSVDVITSTERPCCFEFNLKNVHLPYSPLNDFHVQIITPEVRLFSSTIEDPEDWSHTSNSSRVNWRNKNGEIPSGESLGGFILCYDNNSIGNADFRIVWQSTFNGQILCQDTLTVKCDRTLEVNRVPGPMPGRFSLEQNYPNPFNPVTTIVFEVPHTADVDLLLYDASGRLLRDLGSATYVAGSYRITLDASELPSGMYYYRMRTQDYDKTRSMMLIK